MYLEFLYDSIFPFIFNIEKLNNVYFDSLKLTKRSLTFEDIEIGKSKTSLKQQM